MEKLILENQLAIMEALRYRNPCASLATRLLNDQIDRSTVRLAEINHAARASLNPQPGAQAACPGTCDECDGATGHICARHR